MFQKVSAALWAFLKGDAIYLIQEGKKLYE